MHAEDAYLFRHALLRDAAYQLMPPRARGILHESAIDVIEHFFANHKQGLFQTLALQLADHARLSSEALPDNDRLAGLELKYSRLAAKESVRKHDHASAEYYWRRVADLSPTDSSSQLEALNGLRVSLSRLGRDKEHEVLGEEVEQVARRLGDPNELIHVLLSRAHDARFDHQPDQAKTYADEASQYINQVDDPRCSVRLKILLSEIATELSDVLGSIEYAAQAQELADKSGDPFLKAIAKRSRGLAVVKDKSKILESRRLQAESIRELEAIGAQDLALSALVNAAGHELDHGQDIALAESMLRRCLARARKFGCQQVHAVALSNLASLYQWYTGPIDQAEPLLREYVEWRRESSRSRPIGMSLLDLGRCMVVQGKFQDAKAVLEDAIRHLQLAGPPSNALGLAMSQLGFCHFKLCELDKADDWLRRAHVELGDGDNFWSAVHYRDCSEFWLTNGNIALSYVAAEHAADLFRKQQGSEFPVARFRVEGRLLANDRASAVDLLRVTQQEMTGEYHGRFRLVNYTFMQVRLAAWNYVEGLTPIEELLAVERDLFAESGQRDHKLRYRVREVVNATRRLVEQAQFNPERLFRGFSVDEMSIDLRYAVLARLESTDELEDLASRCPETIALLRDGLVDSQPPDWQSENLDRWKDQRLD